MQSKQHFTRKEKEILDLMMQDYANREIADRLVVSPETVKWYKKEIYRKLGARSHEEAIARFSEIIAPTSPAPAPRTNLPAQTTSLIGRERDLTALCQQLLDENVRLLTLTGSPGIGKTRLVLETAATLLNDFADGVYFISLAALNDPMQVAGAICQGLSLQIGNDQPAEITLKATLSTRSLLLVLDNFEHLMPAALLVSELLAAAPNLKVLATSREPLQIYGEREYLVTPLALPEKRPVSSFEAVAGSDAVRLFIQRARAVKPDFTLTGDNIGAVVEICRRLNGLPLAIELAAARVKLYPPPALLARLNENLVLLTGGAKDQPARHQTLHAAIDWSYELLNTGRQQLFRRLGVFVSGWSLESLQAIFSPELENDVYDSLESLLTKSLIQEVEGADGEPRFILLETIRAYALEKLTEHDEADMVRGLHAEYFLALAERLEPELYHAEQTSHLNLFEAETDNVRIALHWLYAHALDKAARLAIALEYYWSVKGSFSERRQIFAALMERLEALSPLQRAHVLRISGKISAEDGDLVTAQSYLNQSVALFQQLNDGEGMGTALYELGMVLTGTQDLGAARAALEESIALLRIRGSNGRLAIAINLLGNLYSIMGDQHAAESYYTQSSLLHEAEGNLRGVASTKANLGFLAVVEGDWASAANLFEEGLLIARSLNARNYVARLLSIYAGATMLMGEWSRADVMLDESCRLLRDSDHPSLAYTLLVYAEVKARLGNFQAARAFQSEGLELARNQTNPYAPVLESLAYTAVAEEKWSFAAVLFGASERAAETQPVPPGMRNPLDAAYYSALLQELRTYLEVVQFDAAWARGREMSVDEALAYWRDGTENPLQS
jgi:predicted ATPase/DNA-binding CsgD family transcriptional regulator